MNRTERSKLSARPHLRARIRASFTLGVIAGSVMLAFGTSVHALPTGGAVSAGSATIAATPGKTTINQASQNTAINWQAFSIGKTEAVQFVQPNASAVALNRVLGPDPSSILGSLSANGKVFLVNPNGILFGQGAQVNVGGLVASTRGITDADFMAGQYKFSGTGGGTVVNQGTIIADGGYVALLGASVSNQGVISARLGTVVLAAGNAMTLDVAGDGLLSLAVNEGAVNALVDNGGLIRADGGQVMLTAQAAGSLMSVVNNTGVIQAKSIDTRNGTIRLLGDMQSGTINVGGTLDVSGSGAGQTGGSVTATAYHVGLFGAQINASGDAGGGTVLLGGGFQGNNPGVQNASATYMSADSTIRADAVTNGNGGTVVLWSNDSTRAYGTISARGGAQSGDGGMIETSGHFLDVGGIRIDASAQIGNAGTWLLDPSDVTISAAATSNGSEAGGVFTPSSGANASNINAGELLVLLNGGTNVTVTTTNTGAAGTGTGLINVNAPLTWTRTAAQSKTTLTLNAAGDVNLNEVITATGGNLVVCCGRDITVAAGAGSRITTTNGSVLLSAGRDVNINGATTTTDGNFAMCAGRDIHVNAAMTMTRGTTVAAESLASLGVRQGLTFSAGTAATGPGVAGGGGAVDLQPPGGTITVTQGGAPGTAAPVFIIYNPLNYTSPTTNFAGSFTAGTPITVQRLVFPDGASKVFDGTTSATFSSLKADSAGILPVGVTLAGTGTFDTSAVGVGKIITFTGLTLGGPSSASFALPVACCAPAIGRTTGNITAVAVVPVVVPVVAPVVAPVVVPVVVPVVAPVVVSPIVVAPGGVAPVVVAPGVVAPVVAAPVVVAPGVVAPGVDTPEIGPLAVVAPGVAPSEFGPEILFVPGLAMAALPAVGLPGLNLLVVGEGVAMPPIVVATVVPPPPILAPVFVAPPPVVVPPPPVFVPPFVPRRDRN